MVAVCPAIGDVYVPAARLCADCLTWQPQTMRATRNRQDGSRETAVVCVDRDGCRARRVRQMVEG